MIAGPDGCGITLMPNGIDLMPKPTPLARGPRAAPALKGEDFSLVSRSSIAGGIASGLAEAERPTSQA